MMKKLFVLTFLVSFSALADGQNTCSIEMYSKVYRIEANQTLGSSDIIRQTNCDDAVASKISQIIANSTGTIGADFLKREMAKDSNAILEITPRKLTILDLNTVLRDQLTAGTNLYFLDSKSLNGIRSVGLVEGEQIKANCESCSSFGERNIKIDIANPIANTTRTLWFTSKILAKIKVYKAKRNLSFQQKQLSEEDFYADEIYSSAPDNVVTTLENIRYYKPNRTILQGAAVSNLDIQPVNLINFGTPVNVVLKSQNISLQRTAMPTRSALFGEVIELRNPNNNKMIAGKVVDYNKVVIEL